MTEIWMGYTTLTRAKADSRLVITGNRQLEASMNSWLGLSPFARTEKAVA
jgi:hypothetical protein